MDAHHMLPKKHKKYFDKAQININHPQYGTWLDKYKHRKRSYQYNQKWDDFFQENQGNYTQEEIIEYMKQTMTEIYGQ